MAPKRKTTKVTHVNTGNTANNKKAKKRNKHHSGDQEQTVQKEQRREDPVKRDMAPKSKTTKVTFVNTGNTANNKKAKKRKKHHSGDQEQTAHKKQRREDPMKRDMAPKSKTTKVTHVSTGNTANNKKAKENKKHNSGEQEQTSHKEQRRDPAGSRSLWVLKAKPQNFMKAEITQYIESCIDTAILSILNPKQKDFLRLQARLFHLKKRMLQHCKKIQIPVARLVILKNIAKLVAEEQRKMEVNQDMSASLKHEMTKAVDTVNMMEDSTEALEAKLELFKKQREAGDPLVLAKLQNSDPLQLPKNTFEAPTMQEKVKKMKKSKFVFKTLSKIESKPIYKDMFKLMETSYAEIDAL